MIINSLDNTITCNVDKGVYFLDTDSAVGKTRLYQILTDMYLRGEQVFAYSYSDYMKRVLLPDDILSRKIFMVDRYDMYVGELDEDINAMRNNVLVLIDCKNEYSNLNIYCDGGCDLTMETPFKINLEVY